MVGKALQQRRNAQDAAAVEVAQPGPMSNKKAPMIDCPMTVIDAIVGVERAAAGTAARGASDATLPVQ